MIATVYMLENDALREQVLRRRREGVSMEDMASMCGYERRLYGRTIGDASRLERRIGLKRQRGSGGNQCALVIRSDIALHICESLGLDPLDCGL